MCIRDRSNLVEDTNRTSYCRHRDTFRTLDLYSRYRVRSICLDPERPRLDSIIFRRQLSQAAFERQVVVKNLGARSRRQFNARTAVELKSRRSGVCFDSRAAEESRIARNRGAIHSESSVGDGHSERWFSGLAEG